MMGSIGDPDSRGEEGEVFSEIGKNPAGGSGPLSHLVREIPCPVPTFCDPHNQA